MSGRLARWDPVTDRIVMTLPVSPALLLNASEPIELSPEQAFALSRDLREAHLAREQVRLFPARPGYDGHGVMTPETVAAAERVLARAVPAAPISLVGGGGPSTAAVNGGEAPH